MTSYLKESSCKKARFISSHSVGGLGARFIGAVALGPVLRQRIMVGAGGTGCCSFHGSQEAPRDKKGGAEAPTSHSRATANGLTSFD